MRRELLAIETVYAYSPYGEVAVLGPDGGNDLQYGALRNDGTGLYQAMYRYYDPVLKQWISDDPIGLRGGSNQRAYVNGAPTMYTDPLGLISIQEIAETIVDVTGGCSNQGIVDDTLDNFVNTNNTIGLYRLGLGAVFGGSFAGTYGGLTPLQAAIRGVGFRSAAQAAATIGGTMAINAVLVGGMFQAGNLAGSFIRTVVNRGAAAVSCTCSRP